MRETPSKRLAVAVSPYLAMHADDPVDWWPWGADALAEARRRDAPLLVSVGFFACHWCHVQQKESFRDPALAAFVNRSFVAVKVDREIDSALDAALQDFAHRRLGRRGWPLQVMVTPEGYPAAAGLYEPPQAFRQTLGAWAARWRDDAAALRREAQAFAAAAAPGEIKRVRPDRAYAAALVRQLFADALKQADLLQGGFGATAKFPSAPQMLALFELLPQAGSSELEEFLRLTLAEMATLGLRDHLWGGFFRYTVDPGWREPHFEKMLVDNALLALVYLRAAQAFADARWRAVALDTLQFMRSELYDAAAGAFASGLSAQDAQGRDGARYLWDAASLAAILPADERAAVGRLWATEFAPAHALGHLPRQATSVSAAERALVERAYRRLRQKRATLRHPRDEKRLAAGNGLALAALAEAAPHDARARGEAAALVRFIGRELWDGRVLRRLAGSPAGGELNDYAAVAWGLARQATRSAEARRLGSAIARAAWATFYRDGWYRDVRPLLAGLGPAAVIADTHTPSPSALLVLASRELREPALAERTLDALSLGGFPPPGAALGWATQVVALDRLTRDPVDRRG
jgi:uncharacterized protein YyaL (SSP411 family)